MHLDKIRVDGKQPADLIKGRVVLKYPTLAVAAREFQRFPSCEQKSVRMTSGGFTYPYDEIERLCYEPVGIKSTRIKSATAGFHPRVKPEDTLRSKTL